MIHHQRILLFIFPFLILLSVFQLQAQTIEELEDELALLEAEFDSVSIFGFIDSLIKSQESVSILSLRSGYSNQVFINGQDLGIRQFGINNGISYFHKSGTFISYTGFINSATKPRYYLSALSTGFFKQVNSRTTYHIGYDKLFFHDQSDNFLSNSITGSFSYQFKKILLNTSYSFLFGKATAHQIIPSISYLKSYKKIGFIKSIDFSPSIIFFWSNPNIISSNFSENFLRETWLIDQLTPNEINALLRISRPDGFTLYQAVLSSFSIEENNKFTLLNTSISLPINLQMTKHLSLGMTFSYLLSRALILGNVTLNERRINTLNRVFSRLEETLNELDNNVILPESGNNLFFNINVSYSIFNNKK